MSVLPRKRILRIQTIATKGQRMERKLAVGRDSQIFADIK